MDKERTITQADAEARCLRVKAEKAAKKGKKSKPNELDINKDGVVDKKDASLAGKVLNAVKGKKKS